jgi:2-polyprenyl-3-methyl-5-hydroxy-6-metoxy-1,4-benzoquinol methylase
MKSKRDFDQAALDWDRFAPRVKLISDIGDSVLEKVELLPDMDVLDFGCGTGLLSLRMPTEVRSLTGADTSSGMLGVMAGKAAEQGLSNVSTLLLDPESSTPFEGRFDLIVSSMVFHHIEDVAQMLGRLVALLKPGGRICIADLDPDDGEFHSDAAGIFHNGFDRDSFAGELRQAGCSDVEISNAASITKPVGEGEREFTVFLACGRKD